MVYSYWKIEYATPYVNYYSPTFKSRRKGRFYMLSDFVFHLIHRFCFKRILYGYMKYLFTTRVQQYYFNEIHGKIGSYAKDMLFTSDFMFDSFSIKHKPFFSTKQNPLNSFFSTKQNPLNSYLSMFLKQLKTYSAILDFFYTIKYFFFTSVKKKYFINKYFSLKCKNTKLFKKWLYVFRFRFLSKYNGILLFLNKMRNLNKNIYVSISILLFLKKWNGFNIKKTVHSVFSEQYFHVIVRYYLHMFHKAVGLNINTNVLSDDMKLKLKQHIKDGSSQFLTALRTDLTSCYIYNNQNKLSLREIRLKTYHMQLKYFFTFLQTSVRQFNTVFFRYFFLNKINNLKKVNTLNYCNVLNIKYKKDLLISLKKRLNLFHRRLKLVAHHDRKNFYKFLNRLLQNNIWFIGDGNRVKIFRYLTRLVSEISSSLRGILYMNSPLRSKKFSFFYNSHSIRKQLLYTLGKKRYIDEFLLPRNNVFIFQSVLMYYYGFKISFLKDFYNSIETKTRIIYVKDLLTLVEYNHLVFFRKYLTFSLSNFHNTVVVTDGGVKRFLNKRNSFFIGDIIQVTTIPDKFFLFFNTFFFISPVLFNKKHILLYNLYNKTHMYLNNTVKHSFFCFNKLTEKSKFSDFSFKKYFNMFFTISKKHILEKHVFKLLVIFFLKFSTFSTNILNYKKHISLTHLPVFYNLFFLGKHYTSVSLFQYKTSIIPRFVSTKRSRRLMRSFKRKSFFGKKIIRSITNLFSYKANLRKNDYKKYMGASLNKTFTKKVHNNYFYKKFGFLNNKSNFHNMFYDFLY